MESNNTSINFNEINNLAFVQHFLKPLILAVGSYFSGKAFIYFTKALGSGYQTNVKPLWQEYNLLQKYGEYVIINNAGDPLGAEFAKEFARHGHSLILIRVKGDKQFDKVLPTIDKCIQRENGRELRVISKDYDLGDHLIYKNIEKELEKEEIKGKIGILLNNSGLGKQDDENFLTVTSMRVLNGIHTSVVDFLMITKSVLKIIIHNRKGLIVNVTTPASHRSSTESGFPISMKQFTEEFNKNIRRELSKCPDLNVDVEALYPGRICDGYNCCPGQLSPTPQQFVKSAFKVIGRVNSSTGYWSHSVEEFLGSFLPQFIAKLVERMNNKIVLCGMPPRQSQYQPIPSIIDAELGQSGGEDLGN